MKQTWIKFSAFLFAVALLVPASLLAQDEKDKDVKEKKEKAEKVEEKEKKEKKDVQQIIVTRKGDKGEKVIIEISGDKITVNGKPVDEYKDKDGDISVRLQKFKEMGGLARIPWSGSWSGDNYGYGDNDNDNDNDHDMEYFGESSNHAMLGVTTEKADQGVEIQDITKESAAEKAGLKEGDVISKIDDKKIEDPDDLSKIIRDHKPGDKVTVTYFRDKKEQKVAVELTKWKGMESFSLDGLKNFKMDMGNMKLNMPRIQGVPRTPYSQNWSWSGGGPKLGLSVQDADDGKGVKVIDVDEEGNAEKAGIKEDDIITEVDGKAINGADEIAKIIKESKDKISVKVKLQRDGKPMDIDVKIPRKLKTADL